MHCYIGKAAHVTFRAVAIKHEQQDPYEKYNIAHKDTEGLDVTEMPTSPQGLLKNGTKG